MARSKRKAEPTKFDAEQQAAIVAFTGAHRVDACAGAGKTAALVARVKHLQQRGIPDSDILALTFTRSAAEEMRMRTGAEKEMLRTLHSWALSVVKQEVEEFHPPLQHFPLLTNQFEILLPISKKMSVQYKDLTSYISNAKRMGKTPNRMFEESETEMQRAFARAYDQYEHICRRNGVLDFDSIIWELVKLFERKPAVAARHQIRFLMVDEAQDCSEMDWRLICLITRQHGNIWVVGDFAQSIYGFRGSSPQIFAAFGTLFPSARTLPMGTNYRSQAHIVDYSKKVMPEETAYLNNWKAHKPGTNQPEFRRFVNDVDEAGWILDRVERRQCNLEETAILARTNAQLAIIQGFCTQRGIAYKLLGKDNFWKRPEVMALLGIVKNVTGVDDNGLKHAIKSPLPCVKFLRKDAAIEALDALQKGSVGEVPLKHLLGRVYTGDSRQDEILRGLYFMMQGADALRNATPAVLIQFIADRTGARELEDEDVDNAHESFIQDNIRKVVSMAGYFSSVPDLVKFANAAGRPSRKQTRLILSTVHGFKGLEAKNVFVIGVNLGIFPHDRADLQEEKRLYYVAVSRPTERLFVSCAGVPSPFIENELTQIDPDAEDPWEAFQLHA
jgi:DNA helicase-2/ATP-dependent DNA helicase PcrA